MSGGTTAASVFSRLPSLKFLMKSFVLLSAIVIVVKIEIHVESLDKQQLSRRFGVVKSLWEIKTFEKAPRSNLSLSHHFLFGRFSRIYPKNRASESKQEQTKFVQVKIGVAFKVFRELKATKLRLQLMATIYFLRHFQIIINVIISNDLTERHKRKLNWMAINFEGASLKTSEWKQMRIAFQLYRAACAHKQKFCDNNTASDLDLGLLSYPFCNLPCFNDLIWLLS